jgi:hypothetical protein
MSMAGDFLGEARFSVTLLPGRVAYLVAGGSKSGMVRAIQQACIRWAGATEPIIAVTQTGRVTSWDRQVVELSKVDAVVNVDVAVEASAKAVRSLGLPLVALDRIDREGPSMWTCFPGAIAQHDRKQALLLPSDDSLWQATAIGALGDEAIAGFGQSEIVTWVPQSDDFAGRQQVWGGTLLDLGAHQFSELQASPAPMPTPTIIWVTPRNGFDDCRTFWNVRALRSLAFEHQPMLLVPDAGTEHWVDFDRVVADSLQRQIDIEPDVIIASYRVPERRLHEIAEEFGLAGIDRPLRSSRHYPLPERRQPPFTYRADLDVRDWFIFEREYGRRSETSARLFASATEVDLESPVKFRAPGRTLVRLDSSALQHYPRRHSVANAILRDAAWVGNSLQIASRALDRFRFTIQLPTLGHALTLVLAERGVRHRTSDKGVLAEAVAKQAGMQALVEPGTFRLIAELTTPRSERLQREAAKAKRQGKSDAEITELLDQLGSRSDRKHRTRQQIKSAIPDLPASRLEELATLGWVERGLVVKCSQCRITSFILLVATNPEGRCPACDHRSGYNGDQNGLEISYRLNAIVDRASDQGVLPQAMAAAQLRSEDADAHLIPGADLFFADDTRSEADLLGISRQLLIAGEVKTSAAGFTRAEIVKDADRADRIGAEVLVLACPQKLAPATRELAEKLAGRKGLTLRVLDGMADPSDATAKG